MERESSPPQTWRCLGCARTWKGPETSEREPAATAQCSFCGSMDTEPLVNLQLVNLPGRV